MCVCVFVCVCVFPRIDVQCTILVELESRSYPEKEDEIMKASCVSLKEEIN